MPVFDRSLVSFMSRWCHRDGGLYTAFGIAKCSTNRNEGEESVLYWSDFHGKLNYREITEFLDGRFIPLEANGAPLGDPKMYAKAIDKHKTG